MSQWITRSQEVEATKPEQSHNPGRPITTIQKDTQKQEMHTRKCSELETDNSMKTSLLALLILPFLDSRTKGEIRDKGEVWERKVRHRRRVMPTVQP